jgi:CheY-like chemotaxis protein
MKEFELRGICHKLIEDLNSSLGHSNLLKLSIDVKLPDLYYDSPARLTEPIERLASLLSVYIRNGLISIDIFRLSDQGGQVCLQVQLSASGLHQDMSKVLVSKVSSKICSGYSASIFDFSVRVEGSLLICSFKVILTATHPREIDLVRLPFEAKRILIAEDNEINALVFASFLDEWGCETVIVPNGREAVEFLRAGDFDLVLMDIYMPVMNGIEATREIRRFNQDIPIISLTASDLREDIDQAIDSGVNGYLLKPVSSTKLYDLLTRHFTG